MKDLSIGSAIDIAHGVHMPRLGLGTYKSTPDEAARDAVVEALRLGYRSIDTASLYGNEEGVGEGMRLSGVPRDDIFLTTKVWNEEQGYDTTLEAIERSLTRLGTIKTARAGAINTAKRCCTTACPYTKDSA